MKNFFTLKNQFRCIISGKSASGKSTLLSKISFNKMNHVDAENVLMLKLISGG